MIDVSVRDARRWAVMLGLDAEVLVGEHVDPHAPHPFRQAMQYANEDRCHWCVKPSTDEIHR
jgi:hypothetical protein